MSDRSAEELLVHAGWLRALALRIVRDEDVADDLVQDTWVASMRKAPERAESAKSWLAKVMLNTLRMRARSDGRRVAREQATLLIDDEVPAQDVLVARAETQRRLVDLVLGLGEPYRSTVLLHFCEGVPLATIARTQGVPASTVRWRLKTALHQLRDGLDAGGGRKAWVVPLLAIPKGVIVAKKSKTVGLVIALLLLLVGGIVFVRHRGSKDVDAARTSTPSAAGSLGRAREMPSARGADPDRPAWLIQPDVEPRRIAGRVVFGGKPVAGATVELASLTTESGLGVPPSRTTNAAGEFDFGARPATELSVRASAPKRSSAKVDVDLRDPLVRSDRLELVLGACDAAMVGTVTDASGGAIAKARIARLDLESHGDVPGGPAVTTDENGAYELCVETRWPPEVTVEVSAAGYGTIVYRGNVPGRVKTDFALVPEATIVGRVIRDDTRQPVAQAYVYVPAGPPDTERTGWRATFTDATGHFRIDRLAPGNHRVLARAEGLADAVRGVPVSVEAGQTSAEIEIRLEAASTIRGHVVEGDKAVAGARVATSHRTAISQADGSFVLTGVPRGEVTFSAMPYDVVKPKSLVVSQPLHDDVVIEVEELGTITGLVVRGRDPVPGAAVYLKGPNRFEIDPVHTDAQGRFVARGLRAGPWDVGAGSQTLGAFGGADKIVLLARGQSVDVTIDMKYAASIAGRVVDQNGAPAAGMTVAFIHTAADDVGMATTASDGSFRAATMTGGGMYRPVVSATASAAPSKTPLRPAAGGEFPLISLADGSSAVTGVTLAVRLDRLAISGTVVDAAGAPVPDVRVVAELVEGNAEPRFFLGAVMPSGTTDVDGRFSIGDLLAGTYALRARSPAGTDATLSGVRAGRSDATLVLPSPGGIDATLVGFAQPPQVTALLTATSRSSAPVAATVQGNLASIRNLSPGSYLVTARAQTEGTSTIVEVTGGRTTKVTLASKGTGVVAGHVRDRRSGKPVEGMTCRAQPRVGTVQSFGAGGEVRTDAQGAFVLDAPVGDIAVSCDGLWSLYSDGLRMAAVAAAQRLELDVPVVAWNEQPWILGGLGADIDQRQTVARFVRVVPGGPTAVAGFVDGDEITSVDGGSVAELSPGGVWTLIVNRAPGSKVKLEATRAGKLVAGDVTLGPAH